MSGFSQNNAHEIHPSLLCVVVELLLIALELSIVSTGCNLFIQSTVDMCLEGFQVGAITDNAAMNIPMLVF